MSSKSEIITYKSFIELNKEYINNIKILIQTNDNCDKLNTTINYYIKASNKTYKRYEIIINYLLKITDLSILKECKNNDRFNINNDEILNFYKQDIINKKIELNEHKSKIIFIQDKISELLVNDKHYYDWNKSFQFINLEVELMLYEQTYITVQSKINELESLYKSCLIYKQICLYISSDENKNYIEYIKCKTNELIEILKNIKKLSHDFIINIGLQEFMTLNNAYLKLIINQFITFTNKESLWADTWNKKNLKYIILDNIKVKTFKYLFESIYIISILCNFYDINKIYWSEIMLKCEIVYEQLEHNLKNIKENAQKYHKLVTKLKKNDIETLEEDIKQIKIDKKIAYEKAQIAKEIAFKKAIKEIDRQSAINEAHKRNLENKKLIEKAILEKETRLIEIEKQKKEEERIEKENKKRQAIERAAIKAAKKLEKQNLFLLKKK